MDYMRHYQFYVSILFGQIRAPSYLATIVQWQIQFNNFFMQMRLCFVICLHGAVSCAY